MKKAMEERKLEDDAEEEIVLAKHKDDFTKTERPMKKWKYHQCEHCEYKFETTIGAMVAHAEAHENKEIIKNYRVINRKEEGFRPEQHRLNNRNGEYSPGENVEIEEIIIPSDIYQNWWEEQTIGCRKCGEFHRDFKHDKATLKQLAHQVAAMRKHERFCKKKKK